MAICVDALIELECLAAIRTLGTEVVGVILVDGESLSYTVIFRRSMNGRNCLALGREKEGRRKKSEHFMVWSCSENPIVLLAS